MFCSTLLLDGQEESHTDDAYRPERAYPATKRVILFSPHPDDDVISGNVFKINKTGS
jgi:glucosamine-6-phosphate deaminase